ncbi:MAG: hypothetical protein CSA07_00070 [Bacteroidia bacterium]|nr:MAG: hypothetical protein CSA07_00070 [Bacteroidia bacterium]
MATADGDVLILDRDWLEALVSDDSSILADLLRLFEEQAGVLMGMLEGGLERGDLAELRAVAHKLKGSSASIGLRSLAGQLKELERLLDGGEAPGERLGASCQAIQQGIASAIGELRAYVEQRTKNG